MTTHTIINCNLPCDQGVSCGDCGICVNNPNGSYSCIEDIANPCNCVRDTDSGTWDCDTGTGNCDNGTITLRSESNSQNCSVTIFAECDLCCGNVEVEFTARVENPNGDLIISLERTVTCGSSVTIQLNNVTGNVVILNPNVISNPENCTVNTSGAVGINCPN